MSLTPSQLRFSIAALMLQTTGIGLTIGLMIPLTSLVLEHWGVSDTLIGIAAAMTPLAILILTPFLPALARRIGPVRAMICGILVAVAAVAFMAAVQLPYAWIAARFVIGAGLALPWLLSDVWINTIAPEESRGRIILGYVVSLFVGFAIGPLILQQTGLEGPVPLAIAVGALCLAVFPLIMIRKLAPDMTKSEGGAVLAPLRVAPAMAIGAFAAGYSEAIGFSLLPVWGLEVGLSDNASLQLLFGFVLGGITLQITSALIADRVNRELLLGGAGTMLIVAALLLNVTETAYLTYASFLVGGVSLAIYAFAMAYLGARFEPTQLATATASFLVMYQLGSIIGPATTGAIMEGVGPMGFVISMIGIGALLAFAVMVQRVSAKSRTMNRSIK